jgi:hypothetical protein
MSAAPASRRGRRMDASIRHRGAPRRPPSRRTRQATSTSTATSGRRSLPDLCRRLLRSRRRPCRRVPRRCWSLRRLIRPRPSVSPPPTPPRRSPRRSPHRRSCPQPYRSSAEGAPQPSSDASSSPARMCRCTSCGAASRSTTEDDVTCVSTGHGYVYVGRARERTAPGWPHAATRVTSRRPDQPDRHRRLPNATDPRS